MQPLRFQPYLRPMVWGGRMLGELLGKALPNGRGYGESWEVSDHPQHHSVVAAGPQRGQTLRQLMERQREEILGRAGGSHHDIFPWLIKFLDASDWLSVQVHPDEKAVKELWPGEGSKTEAWFVLDAALESRIYAGLRDGVDEKELRRAVAAGAVAECLHSFTPRAGDCVFLPAGTVHAVGGGVLMAEVQQTSDATFRLFDWNRKDAQGKARQLHVEEAMKSIHWDKGPVEPINVREFQGNRQANRNLPLVSCPYFELEYTEATATLAIPGGPLQAVIVVEGKGNLLAEQTEEHLSKGQVVVLPAAQKEWRFEPKEKLGMLIARLP